MKYHNAKAISPVINACIILYTSSCRVQLLDVYAEFFPSLYTYMHQKEQEVTSLLDFFYK